MGEHMKYWGLILLLLMSVSLIAGPNSGAGHCGALARVGKSETEATRNFISLLRALVLEKHALSAAELKELGESGSARNPVEVDDNVADLGAGSLSLAFGNFKRGYKIVNRSGTTLIRDNITAKGTTKFNFRRRFGGGIYNYEAIKWMKFATG